VKYQVCQQKVETRDAVLHCILDAATGIKASRNEVMQATRSIHRRARMRIETAGGHSEQLL
jgi:hypothetical protein